LQFSSNANRFYHAEHQTFLLMI